MAYIYGYKDRQYKLGDLIKEDEHIRNAWEDCIQQEYEFWNGHNKGFCYLRDVIAEATDLLEEVLAEEDVYIEFIDNNTDKDDLNVLLEPLI